MTDRVISPLRRRMIEDMAIRKFAPKTQRDYLQRVKDFAAFLPRTWQPVDFVCVPIVLRLVIERRFAGSLNKMAMATSPRLIVR
jgi:hypothetical protein